MLLRSRALLLPLVASPLLERERANLLGVWKRKHSGQAGMWNCARPAKLAILVALGALSVSRVLAAEESPPLQLADLLLLGAGGAGGYAPPTLNTPYLVGLGDSRTANAGGVVYPAGIQFSTNVEFDGAYIAQLYALSGTKFLPHTQYNYGVAGQSSAGIAGRLTKTGNDCNYPGLSITAACSTALFGTVSSGGSLGTSTVTLSAQPTGNAWAAKSVPAIGSYVTNASATGSMAATIPFGTTLTAPLSSPFTSLTLSNNFIANASTTASSFLIAPPANFSNASLFSSTRPQDLANNYNSTGAFSPLTDPGQVVFVLAGTNDGAPGGPSNSAPSLQSLQNLADILDCLGPRGDSSTFNNCPAGANKIVIIGDEIARELAQSFSTTAGVADGSPEVHSVPLGGGAITVQKSASWVVDDGVYYFPHVFERLAPLCARGK